MAAAMPDVLLHCRVTSISPVVLLTTGEVLSIMVMVCTKFDEVFPKDVEIKSGASFEENIPQEQQELVKSYFKKLAK